MAALNGDASGDRLRKQMAAARKADFAARIAVYSGDSNGRLDLIAAYNAASDDYARLACST
jgi:hypothetical protein